MAKNPCRYSFDGGQNWMSYDEFREHLLANFDTYIKDGSIDAEKLSGKSRPLIDKIIKLAYGKEESAISREEPTTGNVEEVLRKGEGGGKEKKIAIRRGNPRPWDKREIKSPIFIKALNTEVFTPFELALQYFIKNRSVSPDTIRDMYKGAGKEIGARISLVKKGAPTSEEIAHILWEDNPDLNFDTQDYRNAVEEVLQQFTSRGQMADHLVKTYEEKAQFTPNEEVINEQVNEAEKEGTDVVLNKALDKAETLSDKEITDISNDQKKFDDWVDDPNNDIFTSDEPIDFQISSEQTKLEQSKLEAVQKITNLLKVRNPKLKIEYDHALKVAGTAQSNAIKINPFYAGTDTPIHEVAHILIDSIGGIDNRIVKQAVEQLKGTKLWTETKERYPELSEEGLAKEVLAEAIGREGANIFDTESDKSKFRTILEYIFHRIKLLFGLEKNNVKALAKRVIAGDVYNASKKTFEEQRQKPKEEATEIEKEKEYFGSAKVLPKNFVSKKHFGVDFKDLQNRKKELQDKIKSAEPEDKKALQEDLDNLNKQIQVIDEAYEEYKQNIEGIKQILKENKDFDSIEEAELLRMYEYIRQYDDTARSGYFKEIMYRIAKSLVNKQNALLKAKGIDTSQHKFRDLSQKDVLFKSLAHIQHYFPELQQLSKYWDDAFTNYEVERDTTGNELTDLAKEVIKEGRRKEGLSDKAKDILSSNNSKYFGWMDDNGELLTIDKARTQGLSEAKIKYLEKYRAIKEKFAPEQNNSRQIYEENGLIKTDRKFREIYATDGFIAAVQSWLSPNSRTGDIKMYYGGTDAKHLITLNEINADLQRQFKQGLLSKVMAAAKSLYYAIKAQKLLAKKINEDHSKLPEGFYRSYTINSHGQIVNQFGRPYDENKKYSKDFHGAMIQYINDMSFAKNISPILPYVNSIEYYNQTPLGDKEVKKNVVKFIQLWKQKKIFKEESVLFPEIDIPMRFLRNMASMIGMTFNFKAGLWNATMGNYNSWRELGGKKYLIGQKRFFKLNTKTGKYFVSKKARAIVAKYNIVQTESSVDLKPFVGKLFDGMATIFTKLGEYQVQSSMFLGQISKEDYAKINEEGEYTGEDKEAFNDRLKSYKKKVSDINGKYSEKDRRNFENWEMGRFFGQFRTWLPDWYKTRFGDKYYDAYGEEHKGSYRIDMRESFKELKTNVMNGKMFLSDDPIHVRMRQNLRGAMTIAVLLAFSLGNDDDKNKRKKGDLLSQATQNLLVIFDPSTLKFMVATPAPGLKVAGDFLKAFENAFNAKESKGKNKFIKVLPYKNLVDNEYLQEEK